MKRFKHTIAAFLTLLLLLTAVIPMIPTAKAAISTSAFDTKVQAFLSDERWKNGIAWGDSQTPKLSKWSSTGCCAYAADFAAYVYGSTSEAWTGSGFQKFTNLNEIRAGDIIHTSNHWFVVLSRTGNTFYTAEGNFDDKVRVSTDGWGIKDGKIYNLKASDGERTFVYGYHYNFSDSTASSGSSSQIYYNIDLSSQVLKSRINQQVSGDCAVVSMATVEAYLYGATTTAEKNTVYNALVSKNGDNDYAYWSNCGYVSYSSINWDTVYDQLSRGYPVLVHRPAVGSKSQHWAVVAGYKGSTTTLEEDKFVIVDVYHGTGSTDIYTSASWASGTSIDRMVTRKNGIALTSLSGIRMAINHPAAVHTYGEGHGVYGYITSDTNLTSVQLMITNLTAGSNMYNKTVTPNAKSYLLYNLDSEVTFASWPEGEYFYTVIAKTATGSKSYQKYFTIDATWPTTAPTRKITFEFDLGGGTGTVPTQTVNHGEKLTVPTAVPTKAGYTFKGWNVQRNKDGLWFCLNYGWCNEEKMEEYGCSPKLYIGGDVYVMDYSWLRACFTNQEYTFHAVWEKDEAEPTPTTDPAYTISGVTGAAGSTVEVYVSIVNNPGIISLRNSVSYDTSALELIQVEDTGLLNGYTTPSATIASPYTLRWADSLATADNTAQGVVVTLTFKALKAASTCSVSIEHGEARNANGTKVTFAGASATVNVACSHSYGAWTNIGTEHQQVCSGCNDVKTAAHIWNSGTMTKQPTCMEAGEKTYTCTACNATKTEEVAKTETHSYSSWVKVNDTAHKHTCTVCQKEETANHTWNSGTVTKQPTCMEAGEKIYTCTGCGTTKTEVITKLTTHTYDHGCDTDCNVCGTQRTTSHQYKTSWSKSKTEHWHECTECKDKKDVAAHIPGKNATESTPQTCTECGYVIKAALGHTHKHGEAYTTDEAGHWYACSGCEEKVSYTDHDFENACDPDCSVCGYTREVSHSYTDAWESNGENHWRVCSGCGETAEETAHVPGVKATVEAAQTCVTCGYELAPAIEAEPTEPATHVPTKPASVEREENSSFPWWIILVAVVVLGGIVGMVAAKKKK